jgi:hypothetical protein
MHGINWDRVILEKGWFSQTLNSKFIQKHDLHKASLIMVDCDIYSAAHECLQFCGPLIKDYTVIFFDDWNPLAKQNKGEKRAFDEFLHANPNFTAEEFGEYSYSNNDLSGKVFIVSRTV